MPKVPRKSAEKAIGVRYPLAIHDRIQRVMSELSKRSAGLPVPITFVMTRITERGLDAYERELGITKSPKATKAA